MTPEGDAAGRAAGRATDRAANTNTTTGSGRDETGRELLVWLSLTLPGLVCPDPASDVTDLV